MRIKDLHITRVIIDFLKRNKEYNFIKSIQSMYDSHRLTHGYGMDRDSDYDLLISLQEININLEEPYIVTGQSGYFNERIEREGLGDLSLDREDLEIVNYIIECFHNNQRKFMTDSISFFSSAFMGSVEFNFATQTFPAGIEENVFQCTAGHRWPILPRVGESEKDFYIRLLEYQIDHSETFDMSKREEVLIRAKKLVTKFCKNNNRVWFIKLKDVLKYKVSDGDDGRIKYGSLSLDEKRKLIGELETFEEFLCRRALTISDIYSTVWGIGETGITIYGVVPISRLRYIEVERRFQSLQRIARSMGYQDGEEIPSNLSAIREKKTGK